MKQAVLLTGYYEQKNRNAAFGALLLVLIVGSIYFAISSTVSQIVISIAVQISKNDRTSNEPQQPEQFDKGSHVNDDFIKQLSETPGSIKYLTLVLTSIFQFAILLGLTVVLGKKWFTRNIYVYAGYSKFSLSGIFLGALLGLIIIPPAVFIGTYFYDLFPEIKKLSEISNEMFVITTKLDMIFLLFTIGLTPAICEETLFRGVFLRTLSKKYPVWIAILMSSVLFTLFHSSLLSLPSILLAGIVLGIVYSVYDSIYVSMAVHLFYNAGQVLLASNFLGLNKYLLTANGNFHYSSIGIALLVMVLIIIFMYLDKKQDSDIVFYKPVLE